MTCRERILSNDYFDVITEYQFTQEAAAASNVDYCYHNVEGDLGILYLERRGIPEINLSQSEYSYLPKCYGLMRLPRTQFLDTPFDPLSLINSGILSVQGEPLNLTGKGVVIGFIDTGIRYQNSVFRTASGESRILSIWDQTIQNGIPPQGFEYGSEYTKEMIQEALSAENPLNVVPSTDINGHGTAMASVAAGSRMQGAQNFIGAAPDCEIVMVKLKEAKEYLRDYYLIKQDAVCYQETDILCAIQYLEGFALTFRRPLVICLGLGTNLGDHAGTSPLSNYINNVGERKGRCIVIAGGNEGNTAHHFFGTITAEAPTQNVEIRVGENERGFITEFWGEAPFTFSISIRSPGGEIIERITPRRLRQENFSFVFEKTQITLDYFLLEQNSGQQFIGIRFQNPTAGIWSITVYGENDFYGGGFHLWLPIKEFLTSETYFLKPTPNTTLTEPSYTRNAICVSSYDDRNNSFSIDSGRGYASNGRIKPDISAPGVEVSSILGKQSGSSLAAALSAGGSAQLLQWAVVEGNDRLVDSGNIKNFLIRGSSRSSNITYPNREWGFGRLNIAGVFDWLALFRFP